jgi:hypothetical protein
VVLAPVAGVKGRAGCPDPDAGHVNPTVTRTNSSPGRARRKPLKPLRRECRVISGVTAVTTLVCYQHTAHEAAGASGARHSLRPLIGGRQVSGKPRAHSAARSRSHACERRETWLVETLSTSSLRTQGPIIPGGYYVAALVQQGLWHHPLHRRHGVMGPAFAGTTCSPKTTPQPRRINYLPRCKRRMLI